MNTAYESSHAALAAVIAEAADIPWISASVFRSDGLLGISNSLALDTCVGAHLVRDCSSSRAAKAIAHRVRYYPQWIPGEHSPSGPIGNVAGLTITANGKQLPWKRDPHDMFALHMDLPEGVSQLDLSFHTGRWDAAAGSAPAPRRRRTWSATS
ncbi:MAG: hypothetical protein EPN49_09865 [Rhodanobacter sp.]|nr:MAG: hypothetical protein EPN49_09865 [Rhodanobacter sp.]